ncbi:MAG TPA: ATP-binding protein, partial [Planctomycetota bacterium]|nr:ATP-binding protein [Planctomycetota bacterium]
AGVKVDVDDRLGRPLRVDRSYFFLALQNLLLNGAQALRGKGRIVVAASPAPAGGGAVVEVTDDGPGLAPEILPHLFEVFATSRVEGTGLGLSTTRRIVEAHGGTIAAENRPGGGARFEIRLPE